MGDGAVLPRRSSGIECGPVVVTGSWSASLAAWGWLAALAVHLYRRAARVAPSEVA